MSVKEVINRGDRNFSLFTSLIFSTIVARQSRNRERFVLRKIHSRSFPKIIEANLYAKMVFFFFAATLYQP